MLERHGVDYMIIGGYAVAFHGSPRFTKDIDAFYRLSDGNIRNKRSTPRARDKVDVEELTRNRPTFLEIAGVAPPANLDGRSLLPLGPAHGPKGEMGWDFGNAGMEMEIRVYE